MGEGVALLFAAKEARFGHDIEHRYRPDPDLAYLTGFPEPGAAAVLDADRKRFILFVRSKDRVRETWEGRRAGPKGAVAIYGADEAHPIDELPKRLPDLIRKAPRLFHAFGLDTVADSLVIETLARFRREARNPRRGPAWIADPTDLLHEMRLVKEPEEIALLTRSGSIAARAHREAMSATRPGRFEYELEAVVEKRFKTDGAAGPSYGTIVASGPNATILHYVENRRRIEKGDLVLLDAGCEYEGYASDITRTFPASGRFTREQRSLYEIVLRAQEAAIAKVRPGTLFDEVHEAARGVMIDGLVDLGLLKGRQGVIRKANRDARFVLHKTSHWLGRDVHDRGRYVDQGGLPRPLVPGMVLTVEPGIYVREDEKKVASAFLGLGVRIEDDVLVTESEPRVLTDGAPKSVHDLENAVGGRRSAPRR